MPFFLSLIMKDDYSRKTKQIKSKAVKKKKYKDDSTPIFPSLLFIGFNL